MLGASLNADDREINSKFRRLTVKFHPDKIGGSMDRQMAESFYVRLKQARDVLIDPAKRFAYDRFGPEVLEWRSCKTIYDFAFAGVRNTLMYYLGTGLTLIALSVVGYLRAGSFVRIPESFPCTIF